MAYGVGVFLKQDIKDAVDRLRVINPSIKVRRIDMMPARHLFNILKKDVMDNYADTHNMPRDKVNEKNIPSDYLLIARA